MPTGQKVDWSDLEELYWEKQLSSRQIGKIKQVDHCTVAHAMQRKGIPHRTLKESIRLSHCWGERHPCWKGGRINRPDGYVDILAPEHHRVRESKGNKHYVLEHILVWEKVHNKPLPKGWVIHHINGIPNDNRPENLVALPNKKHYLVLKVKAQRIRELEAKVKLLERTLDSQQLILWSEN